MCSKTQCAGRSPWITGFISRPPAVSETISPACTSRIICAPMMSKAQLSEATTKHSGKPSPALIFPRARGRTPCGSRKATTACFVITTVE